MNASLRSERQRPVDCTWSRQRNVVARTPVWRCNVAYLVLFDVQDRVPRSGSVGLTAVEERGRGGGRESSLSRVRIRLVRALRVAMQLDADALSLWKVQPARKLRATNSKLASPFRATKCASGNYHGKKVIFNLGPGSV